MAVTYKKDSKYRKIDPEVYARIAEIRQERIDQTASVPVEVRKELLTTLVKEIYKEFEDRIEPENYFSQALFAQALKVNAATINKYFSKPTDPLKIEIYQLEKLAQAKGWTLDQLVRYFRTGVRPLESKPGSQTLDNLLDQPGIIVQLVERIQDSTILRQITEVCIRLLPQSMIPELIESCVNRIRPNEREKELRVPSNEPLRQRMELRRQEMNLSEEEFRKYATAFGVTDSEWELFWSDRYIPTNMLAKLSRLCGLSVNEVAELKDNHPDAPQPGNKRAPNGANGTKG